MKQMIALQVNGREQSVEVDPATPLLYVLRNELRLNGPKYGCGLDQCGACMALVGGEARTTCRLPVASVKGRPIVTIEGLVGTNGELHPLQAAFVEEQAAQCGYCVNGMLISAHALLSGTPDPDRAAIKEGMSRCLCRCGTYERFVRAVESAGARMREARSGAALGTAETANAHKP